LECFCLTLALKLEKLIFENLYHSVESVTNKVIEQIINKKQEVIMAVEYLCKVCRGNLNVKTSIVLAASKMNCSKRGLVFLNPEIGNYTTTTHPSFQIKEGEEYIYTCPICHSQLNSLKYKHLVRIIMIDDKGKEFDIYFSGIAGEKCTFKIGGTEMEVTGSDSERYDRYFDVPEEDRKYL